MGRTGWSSPPVSWTPIRLPDNQDRKRSSANDADLRCASHRPFRRGTDGPGRGSTQRRLSCRGPDVQSGAVRQLPTTLTMDDGIGTANGAGPEMGPAPFGGAITQRSGRVLSAAGSPAAPAHLLRADQRKVT